MNKEKKPSVYPAQSQENRNYISNLVALAQSRMAYKIEGYLAKALAENRNKTNNKE